METLILKLDNIYSETCRLETAFNCTGQTERFHISKETISKLKVLISDSYKTNDLLSKYAILRYIFETLINVKLLNIEETYTFKLYYSIFSVQVEKTEKFLFKINQEIELAKKYDERETKERKELMDRIDINDKKLYEAELDKITASIDNDSDYENVIFWGDYKNNGYGYTSLLIDKKLKSDYEKRLNELSEKLSHVKTIVYNDNRIKSHFGFTSEEDVYAKLKDRRTWKDKARAVGLENDYTLIYDLSSSIIHATAYSLFTDNDLNQSDTSLVNTLVTRYINNIVRELKTYSNVNILSKFEISDGTEIDERNNCT